MTFRIAALCQQANFRVSSRPASQPIKPCGAFAVLFQPDKSHSLKGKAPCFDKPQGFRQHGERGPQKQQTVLGRQ